MLLVRILRHGGLHSVSLSCLGVGANHCDDVWIPEASQVSRFGGGSELTSVLCPVHGAAASGKEYVVHMKEQKRCASRRESGRSLVQLWGCPDHPFSWAICGCAATREVPYSLHCLFHVQGRQKRAAEAFPDKGPLTHGTTSSGARF